MRTEAWLAADPNRSKGEFVVLVQGAAATKRGGYPGKSPFADRAAGGASASRAVAVAAKLTGCGKSRCTIWR
jgi:16S rRNA (cytidine1402-2'-O)-methyltransferase